jgi:hypothetical protein
MLGDDFVGQIQSVTEEIKMLGLVNDLSRQPDLATQSAANAFLQRAGGGETWGLKQKALEGVYDVIYLNSAVANSTMVTVINMLMDDPRDEVRSQARAIRNLISYSRPDLIKLPPHPRRRSHHGPKRPPAP